MPIRISGSTGISGLDGSATTPVLQGASANSGIYYSGNTVFVSTSGTNAMTIGPTGNVNFANSSVSIGGNAISPVGGKNKIINGGMQIDQRNAGASITLGSGSTAGGYAGWVVDRMYVQSYSTTAGNGAAFTAQRNAGSVTPPANFTNYAGITVTSTQATLSANSVYRITQRIEGYDIVNFSWSTDNAVDVTLSFWVRSSLTGTFGGAITNAGEGGSWRSYAFTYSIASANTWEKKTITIAGPKASVGGSWNSTNSTGLELSFTFGVSSNWGGTPFTWSSSEAYGATGTVNLMATNGATFYLTGVQLEAGSVSTPFEFRPFGTELVLCQRYFETNYAYGTAVGTASGTSSTYLYTPGLSNGSHTGQQYVQFKVTKRANPTMTMYSPGSGNSGYLYDYNAPSDKSGNWQFVGPHSAVGYSQSLTTTTNINIAYNWTAGAEL